ncbi:unnamed protein product [Blepharisma stoltei]|uniref:chitin synthase n=1 Tax=Blepharisma stoltei TaxID=1481888 RepID=A0AAU9JG84_9CILI|nr:unnamed protein product [Blepharisma stoltei]
MSLKDDKDQVLHQTILDVHPDPYATSAEMGEVPKSTFESRSPEGDLLIYQPFKLLKQTEDRYKDDKILKGLLNCDGFEFIAPDTKFRQSLLYDLLFDYEKDEQTRCEILILVAVDVLDVNTYKETMLGITANLEYFRQVGLQTEKICCIVIIDGMENFMRTYKNQCDYFKQFFDQDLIKDFFHVEDLRDCKVNGGNSDDDLLHCFMKNAIFDNSNIKLQMVFAIKQERSLKLNTHLWFFGGFCQMINPGYVMLLEAGTRPMPKALFYLYEALRIDDHLAGCCGELKVEDKTYWNLALGAQAAEYKFNHIFNKSFESLTGYVSEMPSSFSAYQWNALQGDPLWKYYFKPFTQPEKMTPYQASIYSYESEVLTLALVAKHKCNYTLRYVKRATAKTTVPTSIIDLMIQRRCWINWRWHLLVDLFKTFDLISKSKHEGFRSLALRFKVLVYFLDTLCIWFSVAGLYMAFAYCLRQTYRDESRESNIYGWGNYVILLYIFQIIVIFSLSLSASIDRLKGEFKILSSIQGAFIIFFISLQIKIILNGDPYTEWKIGFTLIILAGVLLNVILHCSVFEIAKGIAHLTFLSSSYINIFLINAICNTQENSLVPINLKIDEEQASDYFMYRTKCTLVWALSNATLAYFLNLFDLQHNTEEYWLLYLMGIIGAVLLAVRILAAFIYILNEYFTSCFCKKNISIDENYRPIQVKRVRYSKKNPERIEKDIIIDEIGFNPERICNDKDQEYIMKLNNLNAGKFSLSTSKAQELSLLDESYKRYGDINGDYIRSIRRRKGLSVNQVSKITKIDKYRLKIIENNIDKPTPEEAAILRYYINNENTQEP